MYRCVVILKSGEIKSTNENTKEKCEDWILGLMEKYDLKRSVIVNKDKVSERYTETF